jgi:hypothetical protein
MIPDTERMLREALERLAAEPETQVRYLQRLGSWPSLDELALELDDVAAASESWASPALRDHVRLLSMKLDEMSGEANARLWQSEAIRTGQWGDVRDLASEALEIMNKTV